MRVGLATGFLAALLSLPLLSRDNTSADSPKSDPTPQGILKEKDFNHIQTLRSTPPLGDYKLQETEWANKTYPTIQKALINLYTAEREDNKAINEGKLTEKDRRVKVCLTDFAGPGKEAEDMGKAALHVVKRFEEKQPDNSIRVHYVNEHWPINELTGGILLPETIRVRIQAFKSKDDLYKAGAHNLYVTSMPLLIWNVEDDLSNMTRNIYPLMAQQHLYENQKSYIDDEGKEQKFNPINQTEVTISSPTKCISCHNISPRNHHAKHIFHEAGGRKINYGALTQDWNFEAPFNKQPGYEKYMQWVDQRVKQGFMKQNYADTIARDLMDPGNFENSRIVEALTKTKSLPWVNGDTEVSSYNAAIGGFTYINDKKGFERAIFDLYRPQLESTFINQWWRRNDPDFQAIPASTVK